jgi:hypothetical protein
VHVFADPLLARDAGDAAATWFSEVLGAPMRLVYFDHRSTRAVQQRYAGALDATGRLVSFTDGAPLLVLGTASGTDLNVRLMHAGAKPIPLDRFRANIVIATEEPYVEDRWTEFAAGAVRIALGDPCRRCVIPTIDWETTAGSKEPTRTLATYRRWGDHVIFGVNATHATPGALRVGDSVCPVAR